MSLQGGPERGSPALHVIDNRGPERGSLASHVIDKHYMLAGVVGGLVGGQPHQPTHMPWCGGLVGGKPHHGICHCQVIAEATWTLQDGLSQNGLSKIAVYFRDFHSFMFSCVFV